MTIFPAQIDNTQSLPMAVDNLTPVQASVFNQLRSAIIAIESALGVQPGGVYSSVGARFIALETTVNNLQTIQLTHDLGGTISSPLVVGLQGRPLSGAAPSLGQVLEWNGVAWVPTSLGAASAVIFADPITKVDIQSARASHQLSTDITKVGITNLGSDSLAILPPVTGNYATVSGGNTCWAGADYATVCGGNVNIAVGAGATCSGGTTNLASGGASHAQGIGTAAIGTSSTAEGNQTVAIGNYSHAEGNGTHACGQYSHTEGLQTIAGNDYQTFTIPAGGTTVTIAGVDVTAQFFGGDTVIIQAQTPTPFVASVSKIIVAGPTFGGVDTTFDIDSPIDGVTTGGVVVDQSAGTLAHAEGYLTKAVGQQSHAEGNTTSALGDNSHAECFTTTASGFASHAEGNTTVASGDDSHAEGSSTLASNDHAHAEGGGSHATGSGSHAEGLNTIASATSSHAEGSSTIACGSQSHAEGNTTIASGVQSHAEGINNIAAGDVSHVEGEDVLAFGDFSHGEGDENTAGGTLSHVEGAANVTGYTALPFSMVAGDTTITINGDVRSQYINGDTVRIQPEIPAVTISVARTVSSVPVFGSGNTTFLIDSPFDSSTTSGFVVDTNFGVTAHAEGELTVARGAGAHSEGNTTNALADQAHSEGNSTNATGLNSHSEGFTNYAAGQYTHVEGEGNFAFGDGSHAEGAENSATGTGAHVEGVGSAAGGTISNFTITADDTTVTIAGDVRSKFVNGDTVRIQPVSPAILASLTKTISSIPAFGSGNTTFLIDSAIDLVTTGGVIVDTAIGLAAHAEGEGTLASGASAHAEGSATIASGEESHAEGLSTQAIGVQSHAEGNTTIAFGVISHSEGFNTTAYGDYSHVQGNSAIAAGTYSDASGTGTIASGQGASAKGQNTLSAGQYSHAEGSNTFATGSWSHAEGVETQAGYQPQNFTIPANGTLVTIVGNVTSQFVNGDPVTILPQAPAATMSVLKVVNSIPAFGAGNTTFNLNSAIDTTTTGGTIVDNAIAQSAHAEGESNQALARSSHVQGAGAFSQYEEQDVHACGPNDLSDISGAIQTSVLVLRGSTISSGAGETVELKFGTTPTPTATISLIDGKAYTVEVSATIRRPSSPLCASIFKRASVRRDGGTVVVAGTDAIPIAFGDGALTGIGDDIVFAAATTPTRLSISYKLPNAVTATVNVVARVVITETP